MLGGLRSILGVPFIHEVLLTLIASASLLGYFGLRLRARWVLLFLSYALFLSFWGVKVFGLGVPGPVHGPGVFASESLQLLEAFLGFFFLCSLLVGLALVRVCPLSITLSAFILLALWVSLLASEWFFLWVWLEVGAVLSYGLVALGRTSASIEAAVKYFSVGLISSGVLAFGIVTLGLAFGDSALYRPGWSAVEVAWFSGFLLSPLLIKLGAAPFHFWVPDTYEGAPLFTTIFLSVVVKLGLFFVLVKVLCACCVVVDPLLGGVGLCAAPRLLLAVGGLFSMFFGGFGALFQNRLKRLLAYSSIGNLGFALCGLTSVGVGGLASSITYMLVYSFSMLLLFTVVVKYRAGRGVGRTSSARYSVVFVTDVSRLLESGPYVGRVRPYIFISTLFSLAGIPPLAGFWAKYFVLESLVLKGGYLGLGLAAFAFGYSVLASFYYLNLIRLACHTRASYGVAPEEKAGRALLLAGLVPFRADCLRVSAQMVCWSTVLYGWVVLPQQFYRVVSGGLGPDLLLLNPLFQASASPLF